MSKIRLSRIRNNHKRVTPTIPGARIYKPQNLSPPPSPVNNAFNREVFEIKVKLANAEQKISLLVKDYNKFFIDEITIDDITKHEVPPVLLSNEYDSLSPREKKRYDDIQKEIKDAKIEWDKLQTQLDAHNTNVVFPTGDGVRTKKRKRKQKSKKGKSKKKGKAKKQRKTNYKQRRTRSK